MIDLHCDTIMQLIDHPRDGDLFSNHWKIDIERLIKGHSRLQDFALFVDLEEQDDSYGRYESMRQLFNSQIENMVIISVMCALMMTLQHVMKTIKWLLYYP